MTTTHAVECIGLCCDAMSPQTAQDHQCGLLTADDTTCDDCRSAIERERRSRSYTEPEEN